MKRALSLVLGLMLLFSVLGIVTAIDWTTTTEIPILRRTGGMSSYDYSYDSEKQALKIYGYDKGSPASAVGYVINETVGTEFKVKFMGSGSSVAVGAWVILKSGATYGVIHVYGASSSDYINNGYKNNLASDYDVVITGETDVDPFVGVWVEKHIRVLDDLSTYGITADDIEAVYPLFMVAGSGSSSTLWVQSVSMVTFSVTFSLKDALSGSALSGVTVKEGDTVLGTLDDGGSLELTKGTHTLTFEKSGYWSVQKTIDVQNDMSVSVEMYPSSAAFKLENFPSNIQIYENSIYELTFTLSPIQTSATYNTYLSLSGLSDVLEVKKDGSTISPEGGKYYLGDISGPTQVSIKFKAGAVGTHGFTLTLTSNDAIMSKTYTTTKQVTYQVEPLPFSVQMPSEWQVGANEVRVSEASGQSILITAILKDSNGTEVWSDSTSLGPYEAYTFQVNVPSEGTYTLELQFNGQTASWDIQVNPAISLLTETITASEGDIATVQVKLKNPSSSTKYYTIVLEGPIIEGNVSKSVSVAPLSEKTVDLAFQVPKNLEYDAYDLTLKVLEGDSVQFSDTVHLVIDNSGFSLPVLGGEGNTWLWIGAAGLALLIFVVALRRR